MHLSKISEKQQIITELTAVIKKFHYKPTELLDVVIIRAFSTRLSSIGAMEKNGFRSCGSSDRNLHIASSNSKTLHQWNMKCKNVVETYV